MNHSNRSKPRATAKGNRQPVHPTRQRITPLAKNRVFIVHGHDEAAKHTTARFVQGVGLKPIILHEQVSGGDTIIEKFHRHGEVAFAIAIMTPDDIGYPRREGAHKKKMRARQNVVFETGFFIGRLGRGRVLVLYKPGTELPTDYGGIVYVLMDEAGGWQLAVAKEMIAAGLEVNWDLTN